MKNLDSQLAYAPSSPSAISPSSGVPAQGIGYSPQPQPQAACSGLTSGYSAGRLVGSFGGNAVQNSLNNAANQIAQKRVMIPGNGPIGIAAQNFPGIQMNRSQYDSNADQDFQFPPAIPLEKLCAFPDVVGKMRLLDIDAELSLGHITVVKRKPAWVIINLPVDATETLWNAAVEYLVVTCNRKVANMGMEAAAVASSGG